eukprot:613030_1
MEYTASHQREQREIFKQMLNDQTLADTTFIIGSDQSEYNINRLFLASSSPVFLAMLFGKMKESELNSDVIIEDMRSNTFECILNFAHGNDPQITTDNVLHVIQASDKYQIKTLLQWGEQYLRSCLSESNFCTLFNQAFALNQPSAIELCMEFIQSDSFNADELMQTDAWKQMSVKAMRAFLKSDWLRVKEERLWSYVEQWGENQTQASNHGELHCDEDIKYNDIDHEHEHETCDKTQVLKTVCDLIRFPLMNGKYFATKVVPQNILTKDEVITILLYFQNPEGGCGEFITAGRTATAPTLLKYTLSFTYKHPRAKNTYEALINYNLSDNCGTGKSATKVSAIKATFESNVQISKIEIGAPSIFGGVKEYGCNFLSRSHILYLEGYHNVSDNTEWKLWKTLPEFKAHEIKIFRHLDIKAK